MRNWRSHLILQVGGMLVGGAAIALLHTQGLAGPLPLWVCLTTTVLATAGSEEHLQRWWAGGDLGRQVWLRVPLSMILCAPGMYVTGWGPMMAVGYVPVALLHLRWSGSRAWRPSLAGALIGISLGQLGVGLHLLPSYLPPGESQAVAGLQVGVVVLVLAYLGRMVSAREQAEASLALRERSFRKLVHNSSDLILLTDSDGLVTWAGPSVEHLLGQAPEELVGQPVEALLDPADRHLATTLREWGRRTSETPLQLEWRLRRADGSEGWYDVVVQNLLHDPDVRSLLLNQRDVTDSRLARERLRYDATHDLLTGLLNRAAFLAELGTALSRSDADRGCAVLYIDLDGFKPVNDRYGHEAGDAVLVAVGRSLRDATLGGDVVARLGGDEFAVLLPSVDDPDGPRAVAQRISAAISSPLAFGEHVLLPRASVGLATTAGERLHADEILRRADSAMYGAKRRGKPWVEYGPSPDHAEPVPASMIARSGDDRATGDRC